MIKNVILITLRNFIRQKGYSIINILGLAIGMAAFILIMLWVEEELSYEKSHTNADNIFLTYKGYSIGGKTEYNAALCFPLGPYVKEHVPEAKNVVRVVQRSATISYEDKVFSENDFIYADSGFFDVFTYEVIQGNPESFFKESHSVVISKSIAEKYFGNENSMGKILTHNRSEQYVVSGVVEDPLNNTHMEANIIVSMAVFKEAEEYTANWNDHFLQV